MSELEPDGDCRICHLHYELDAADVRPMEFDSASDIDHHHDDDEDSISESDLHFVVNDDEVEYDT